jgi:hypothetical protein
MGGQGLALMVGRLRHQPLENAVRAGYENRCARVPFWFAVRR